ncbi:MAG: DUF2938 domain-containing protein [Pseudomonadota bacterium]
MNSAFAVGIVATAVADLWGLARKPLLGVPAPDYGLVGRWFGHMLRGQFRHTAMKAASPVHGELVIGWIAHYLTGIAFAGVLIAIGGHAWLHQPTIGTAMAVGIGSVVAPFLIMQPAMGAGFAASRTPNPGASRVQSLLTHAAFGVGLYVGGWGWKLLHIE